jgi:hypothetical protein
MNEPETQTNPQRIQFGQAWVREHFPEVDLETWANCLTESETMKIARQTGYTKRFSRNIIEPEKTLEFLEAVNVARAKKLGLIPQ